jgi:hypothetical protein
MKLFAFSFGSGYYDIQNAVVMAETMEEARALLISDIERQHANAPRRDGGRIDCNWVGENGFSPSYHSVSRFDEAVNENRHPNEIVGPVAYLIGVDG